SRIGAGADATGHRGCGSDDQRTTHAVALRPDLLVAIHLSLPIEPGDERWRVAFDGSSGTDRSHQRGQLRALRRIAEVEVRGVFDDWRLCDAVKRIGYQY